MYDPQDAYPTGHYKGMSHDEYVGYTEERAESEMQYKADRLYDAQIDAKHQDSLLQEQIDFEKNLEYMRSLNQKKNNNNPK